MNRDREWDFIDEDQAMSKLRWLQVKTLKEQYPNDQELGKKVRELVNNTN
jgi:hypothetical protein